MDYITTDGLRPPLLLKQCAVTKADGGVLLSLSWFLAVWDTVVALEPSWVAPELYYSDGGPQRGVHL